MAELRERYKGFRLPSKYRNEMPIDVDVDERRSEQGTSTGVAVDLATGIEYY